MDPGSFVCLTCAKESRPSDLAIDVCQDCVREMQRMDPVDRMELIAKLRDVQARVKISGDLNRLLDGFQQMVDSSHANWMNPHRN